jgi:hypothetical protein
MTVPCGERLATATTVPMKETLAPYDVVAFARSSTSAAPWTCGRGHKRGVMRVELCTSKSARGRDERQGRARTRESTRRIAR